MNKIGQWLETHIELHNHDTREEEIMNSGTHAFGAVLSLIGLVFLVLRASTYGEPRITAGAFVFSLTMILMYTSSALYHKVPASNLKRFLRVMDHINIYLLIAGTYTPICIMMNSPVGNTLLSAVWTIAGVGIISKLIFWGKVKPLHTIFYLIMGWLIFFFREEVETAFPATAWPWMVWGGLSYTVGTIFYAIKKIPHYHAIWHLFVISGSVGFYFMIYLHVMPGL